MAINGTRVFGIWADIEMQCATHLTIGSYAHSNMYSMYMIMEKVTNNLNIA